MSKVIISESRIAEGIRKYAEASVNKVLAEIHVSGEYTTEHGKVYIDEESNLISVKSNDGTIEETYQNQDVADYIRSFKLVNEADRSKVLDEIFTDR